jgi:SAM-dependent methyltransferase
VAEQRYVIEETVQQRYVANRDAKTFLPFLLPHLRAGMDVLDAGCGVGSIALDLAPTVAPGRVVGIDLDPEQIEVARKTAAERGIENVEFTTGSVLELPFDAGTFDIVYANAVLFYLREQKPALVEMRRVLRPGGIAAVSDDDISTVAVSPDWPEVKLGARLFELAVAHEGGNSHYSRHLRTLMLEAGFARVPGGSALLQRLLLGVKDALLHGLQQIFFWSAVIMSASILLHLMLKREPLRTRMTHETDAPAAAAAVH